MKAEELMIGDLVIIDEPDRHAGCVCKIRSLFDHGADEGVYFNVIFHGDKGCGSKDVFNEDIRPIPLTGEILEKNGFKLRENCTSAWDWDKGEISIQVTGLPDVFSRQTLTIYTSGGVVGAGYSTKRTLSDLSIHYVHQLQHAIKLCGINKEIVL